MPSLRTSTQRKNYIPDAMFEVDENLAVKPVFDDAYGVNSDGGSNSQLGDPQSEVFELARTDKNLMH